MALFHNGINGLCPFRRKFPSTPPTLHPVTSGKVQSSHRSPSENRWLAMCEQREAIEDIGG